MAKQDDPILSRIIKLLNEHGPKELKGRYGIGDPGVINKSQLQKPMAFVSYETQEFSMSSAFELGNRLPIAIDVVVDMTKDFGQGLNAYSHSSVIEFAAGRNKDFSVREDSVVGALRSHQDMTENDDDLQLFLDVETPTRVEFDYQNRDKGLVTAEAVVHFTVGVNQLLM